MSILQHIAAYLLASADSRTLQNKRLTQMLYLVDWKSCLTSGEQITSIHWELNDLGPFSDEVLKEVIHNRGRFKIDYKLSGELTSVTTKITLSTEVADPSFLDLHIQRILDFVIASTRELDYEEFTSFIYSTYPVVETKRFSPLNLKMLSKAYKMSRFWNNRSMYFDN